MTSGVKWNLIGVTFPVVDNASISGILTVGVWLFSKAVIFF
jgi:hypothetical protein